VSFARHKGAFGEAEGHVLSITDKTLFMENASEPSMRMHMRDDLMTAS
jgi:hypothetical protein